MIQIGKTVSIYAPTKKQSDSFRRCFEQKHYVYLSGFLELSLLKEIQRKLRTGSFYERTHPNHAVESCLRDDTTSELLNFLTNDSRLFQLMRSIADCEPIGCLAGRAFRMEPLKNHYDYWHSDIFPGRLLAFSLNLTEGPYEGGLLQIKEKKTGKIVAEVKHEKPGDAIVFRIHPDLRHRVTEVRGSAPRMVYAGWFRSSPNFMDLVQIKIKNGKRKIK